MNNRLFLVIALLWLVILGCGMPGRFFNATPTSLSSIPSPTPNRPPATATFLPTSPIPTLAPEILERLEVNVGQTLQLQPGDSYQLKLGTTECCYVFVDVPVDVTWSVDPTSGIVLDPKSGMLKVSLRAGHGSAYTITANIENSRRVLSTPLLVYTQAGNPLVGTWYETARLPCGEGAETVSPDPLSELVFEADGTIKATWYPFEVYHDYWGKYSSDLAAGTLTISEVVGNYIPSDLDLEGLFEIGESGDLILKEIWLGSWQGEQPPPGCGQRFKRR